jgi:hypothetical protein
MARTSLTAFPHEESRLREDLACATLDHASLRRPLQHCDLAHCQGMCCYDGIYVEDEVATVLEALAVAEAPFFHALGVDLPEQVIVEGTWKGLVAGKKTAVAPRSLSTQVDGYPSHFHDTACVFLVADGRCSLQMLGVARGKHKWYYKPFGCWLHPLSTERGSGGRIALDDVESDPFRLDDYEGFVSATFCGREVDQGTPAATILEEELQFLGGILGRELM